MKVLVTGGAGFIGSHFCELLLEKGFSVVCVDNLITGREENIKQLLTNNNFRFVNHDISETINLNEKFDFIVHLASPASPVDFARMPLEILKVNSIGTMNCLELARKNNAVFLLASTSEVYGDPEQHPQKESYHGNVNPVGLRSCYDESKRFAEALTMAYHRKYNMKTRVVRIFNTYGPRMQANDGRVTPNFITQALANKPITVYGDGKQTRSFCYVTDMVDGICKLMLSDVAEPVNIGNPDETTILELANRIIKITGSSSKVVFKPLPEDDPSRRCPDITKAKQLLNWTPKVSLEEGLRRTIDYFKGQ